MLADRPYVDSSAFVKLFADEPESETLRGGLARMTSSDLLAIEVLRAARRLGSRAVDLSSAALSGVKLVPIGDAVRDRAGVIGPPGLRSLDSIHLATADLMRADIDAFVTYDRRLGAAVEAIGIPVLAPG